MLKLADYWRSSGANQKALRADLSARRVFAAMAVATDATNHVGERVKGVLAHRSPVEAPFVRSPWGKDCTERVVAMAVCAGLMDEIFIPTAYAYNAYVVLGR